MSQQQPQFEGTQPASLISSNNQTGVDSVKQQDQHLQMLANHEVIF